MNRKWTALIAGGLLAGLSGVAAARDDVQFGFYLGDPGYYYAPPVYTYPPPYYYGHPGWRARDRDDWYRERARRDDRGEHRGEWRDFRRDHERRGEG